MIMQTATKETIERTRSARTYHPPTQSQRLRSTLYRLWERSGSQLLFEDWYSDRMNRIITRLQRLLD